MLRTVASVAIRQGLHAIRTQPVNRLASKPATDIGTLTRSFSTLLRIGNASGSLRTPFTVTAQPANINSTLQSALVPPVQSQQPSRTVIKFSMVKGKRKSVKPVIKRFKRLDWGGWIRTMSGRHKHMWKKSAARKRRLRQHVMVNSQQAHLLDKMVTKYWKRPKHYINDPYEPYHTREELRETRRKPVQY
uniref:50S ribosomal protein L35 n=1 Tax=Culex pipiens TaxID=7175 RepID=A0A8D8I9J2_CULPI